MSYLQPTALASALDAMACQNLQVVAGGTDVFAAHEMARHGMGLLDITRIKEIRGVQRVKGGYRIGSTTTWREIIDSDLPSAFNGLKAAGREVGSIQIQNAATIAGNLCNASPAADGVPPLLTLNATVEVASVADGVQRVPIHNFIKGVRQTSLAADQLVTSIYIPEPAAQTCSAFTKLGGRHYMIISIAMTAALVLLDDKGLIKDVRLAVGACSAIAKRLTTLEQTLVGAAPESIRIQAADIPELAPIDDVRGTAQYRRDVVAEQCRRVIAMAVGNE